MNESMPQQFARSGSHLRRPMVWLAAVTWLWSVATSVFGQPAALTAEQWRTDILEMSRAIHAVHPDPFRHVGRQAFTDARDALLNRLGSLDDREIVVRMAMLAARIEDGHTRLRIPRRHPHLSIRQSHSGTPPPAHQSLRFDHLPIRLEAFDDGVFVISAARGHADLLGARVESVGTAPIEDVVRRVGAVVSAENEGFRRMMAVDRIALPDVLKALQIVPDRNAAGFSFRLADGSTLKRKLKPIGAALPEWIDAHAGMETPVWARHPGRKYWWSHLERRGIVYLQIDEIANEREDPLPGVVRGAIEAAEAHDVPLVIDLRWNFGGSGSFNRPVVLGILGSETLNRYGRSFVLTGPRTFSAAQMLVNDLEEWSRVLFVGLPTGSRPDHHGDSRKIRLEHSGVTLRVSTLHWPAYEPNDRRDAVAPLIEAPFTSAAWFSGTDPAVAAIAALPERPGVVDLFGMALENVGERRAARFITDHFLDPDAFRRDLSEQLTTLAENFRRKGNSELADLTLRYGLYFYPEHPALSNALKDPGTD